MARPRPPSTSVRAWLMLAGACCSSTSVRTRALLHHTSGQARIGRFLPTAPGHAAMLPRLSHYDGRLMYAASMSGLGVGPVTHDNLPDFAPYRPAWYRVRFTVPRDWRHPGVLGVQVPGIRRTGEWPAEPGHTGETWVSGREVALACWPFPFACQDCAAGHRSGWLPCPTHGWGVQIQERLLLTAEQKPLDT
ncbi:MAG TPA: hypothetical protein VGS80_13650 [Ktedonobacterales bacterium]|nr:hypothetical protein [Ktedonobacterales bacterium]